MAWPIPVRAPVTTATRPSRLKASRPRPRVAGRSIIEGPRSCFPSVVKPPESHLDLLERPLFAHLATVRADGAPQVNPMWFLYDADRNRILLTHTKVRHNYRYLQAEPRVAL